jgi:hypothetical protein
LITRATALIFGVFTPLVAEFDTRAVHGALNSPGVELGDKTALTMPLSPKRSPGILTGPEGLQAPTT